MPDDIRKFAASLLGDPVEVTVTPPATTVELIDQRVIHVAAREKPALLATLLNDRAIARALVFTRTKRGADRVTKHLAAAGIAAAAIHGNKSQGQREQALAAFRAGSARVLVATDIAARGIDVDGITHVINFELPNVPESYVHRIGRTARAGAAGARDLVLRRRGTRAPARHRNIDPPQAAGRTPFQQRGDCHGRSHREGASGSTGAAGKGDAVKGFGTKGDRHQAGFRAEACVAEAGPAEGIGHHPRRQPQESVSGCPTIQARGSAAAPAG